MVDRGRPDGMFNSNPFENRKELIRPAHSELHEKFRELVDQGLPKYVSEVLKDPETKPRERVKLLANLIRIDPIFKQNIQVGPETLELIFSNLDTHLHNQDFADFVQLRADLKLVNETAYREYTKSRKLFERFVPRAATWGQERIKYEYYDEALDFYTFLAETNPESVSDLFPIDEAEWQEMNEYIATRFKKKDGSVRDPLEYAKRVRQLQLIREIYFKKPPQPTLIPPQLYDALDKVDEWWHKYQLPSLRVGAVEDLARLKGLKISS